MSDCPRFSGHELSGLEAHVVVDMLVGGEVKPSEVLEISLDRIASVEADVNAMPTVCGERAASFLKTLDTRWGQRGWLGGLPIGIKDLMPVGGVRTTFGTRGYADFVPDTSDPLVEVLEGKGAAVVGKTNTPEFGAGGNTFNDVFGPTRNPWDTSLNAGGSSGGAAVSLATGEVWLSHGSDLAGSLRTPAAFCGVVGLRPSPGMAGGGPAALAFHTEAVQGPMARSVTDCALFLDAMSDFDSRWPISHPPPSESFFDAVQRPANATRIAFAPDLNGFGAVAGEMRDHLGRAMTMVESAGAAVELACPDLTHLEPTYRTLRAMLWAAGPGRAPASVQRHFKATLAGNIGFGRSLTIDDLTDAQVNRTVIYQTMRMFLDEFDALACPVVGVMPGPVEEEYPPQVDGQPVEDYIDWLRFSFLAPVAWLPAISVPVGRNAAGLPIGIQLIGRPRGEAALLRVARLVEKAVGGPLPAIDPVVRHR